MYLPDYCPFHVCVKYQFLHMCKPTPCARCSHKGTSPCWSSRGPPRWADRPPRLSPLTSLHACTSVPSQHFMCWQTHTAELHLGSQSVILSLGSNHLAAHLKAGRRNSHRVGVTRAGGSCWRCASRVHKNVHPKTKFPFPTLVWQVPNVVF